VSEHLPTLILETGRALVDEAGYLISSVLGKNNLPSGDRAGILDAGGKQPSLHGGITKVTPPEPSPGLSEKFSTALVINIEVIRPACPSPSAFRDKC
jgi:diaminopimelate decarboxylase